LIFSKRVKFTTTQLENAYEFCIKPVGFTAADFLGEAGEKNDKERILGQLNWDSYKNVCTRKGYVPLSYKIFQKTHFQFNVLFDMEKPVKGVLEVLPKQYLGIANVDTSFHSRVLAPVQNLKAQQANDIYIGDHGWIFTDEDLLPVKYNSIEVNNDYDAKEYQFYEDFAKSQDDAAQWAGPVLGMLVLANQGIFEFTVNI
jgi:hypothetical protein